VGYASLTHPTDYECLIRAAARCKQQPKAKSAP
jgi:hypothetical protein